MRRIIALKKKPQKTKRNYRPRRIWSLPQKLAILARAEATSTLTAAREFDVDVRLLFQWRQHHKLGELEQRTWKAPGRPKRSRRETAVITGDEALQEQAMEDEA